jgi:hypothetical protein
VRKFLTFAGLAYLLYLSYFLYKGAGQEAYLFDHMVFGLDKLALFT